MKNNLIQSLLLGVVTATLSISSMGVPVNAQETCETTKTTEANPQTEGFYNNEAELTITKTSGYDSRIINADGGSAEIIQYNSDTGNYYVVNGTSGTLDIVPREVYAKDNKAEGIKFDLKTRLGAKLPGFVYGDMTSVAVNTEKDLVAVAVQAAGTNDTGLIVLMDYDNNIVNVVEAGVQPDMVTFTEDGNKVLSANEGEPRDGYGEGTTDPMGTITVVDLRDGAKNAAAQNITFEDWDAKRDELTEAGVIIKKETAPSVDFEPEYIAVNSAGTKAYAALQEANAIATVDLTTNKITFVKSLGFKDHSQEGNELDVLKKDETINLQNEDYYGIYMPDGISIYEVDGTEYILTANEGDSREWGDYINEIEEKVGESKSKVVFFDTSDYDGVDADKKYLFGARSFAIYNAETMEQVYESGSDFETITAEVLPDYFNCSNDDIDLDSRSGKKGPEAESVVVGEVNGKTYAFIGLERIGGIMVYDITDPANSSFANYINSRDFSAEITGDVSPEGLAFIPAEESISGNAELLAAHEVSGTVAVYELTAGMADGEEWPFTDVTEDNWFYDEVKYVFDNGLMIGMTDTTFAPQSKLTRAQFAEILYRTADEEVVEYKDLYNDVAEDKWYTDAIIWASEAGIIKGYGNGKFGPDDNITREQMAVMMYNFAKAMGYDVNVSADLDDFADSAEVHEWAKAALEWAAGNGIFIGNDDGMLEPLGDAGRAECAAVVMRFMQK